MKVGFVSDTHSGLRDEERVVTVLERLAEGFKERGVDTVVHLGDIAHEEPQDTYQERVETVAEVFTDFNYHMTLGNHDIQAISLEEFESEFEEVTSEVIARENGETLIKMNSAGEASIPRADGDTPVGYIPDDGRDLILDELSAGNDVTVCTHYPLQYIPLYQSRPFFDVRPEYVFPINKLQFEAAILEAEFEANLHIYCGHLHPEESVTLQSEPFGIWTTVVEPVQLFEMDGDEIVWEDNLNPKIDDLVLRFGDDRR